MVFAIYIGTPETRCSELGCQIPFVHKSSTKFTILHQLCQPLGGTVDGNVNDNEIRIFTSSN